MLDHAEADYAEMPSASSGSLTYEPYYGLLDKPFSLSADPRFLYKSRTHGPAFENLLAAIRRREGLIVLTGDIGTGKTTLCRSVLANLDRKTFSSFVPDPFMSREDLLKMLLIDFGVMSIDDLKSGRLHGASRLELSYLLYEFLDSLVPLEAFAVLVIDEAQNLAMSLLEEVRILSELERREKLLQVMLVGQLELQSRLKLPQMRQVDQRVSMRCELAALDQEEIVAYVAHRLSVASGGYSRVSFSPAAVEMVWHASRGVPRLVNLICDRALQRGYLKRVDRIEVEIVSAAIVDLGLGEATAVAAMAVAAMKAVSHMEAESNEPTSFVSEPTAFSNEPTAFSGEPAALSLEPALTESKPEGPMPEPLTLQSGSESFDDVVPAITQGEIHAPEPEPVMAAAGPAKDRVAGSRKPLLGSFETSDAVTADAATGERTLVGGLIAASFLSAAAGTWWYLSAFAAGSLTFPLASPAPLFTTPAVIAIKTPDSAPPLAVAGSRLAGTAVGAVSSGSQLYFIQVASFESAARASRLVEDLTKSGYRAGQVEINLGDRGVYQQVLVGGYGRPSEAQADLERIRRMPAYVDARIIEPRAPAAP